MPKVFYHRVLFFFVRHSISEVTERISTKLGHIFTYDCYMNSPGHLPPRAEGKNHFSETEFNFWPNVSLQRNMISTIGKKLVNLQGLPYMPSKFCKLWSRNGRERLASFCPRLPLNFSIGRHCQLYHMDVI